MRRAGSCRSARASGRPHPIRAYLSLKPSPSGRERIAWYLLIDVDGLGMLPQVVEAGEAPRAMALEWSFAGMLAGLSLVDGQIAQSDNEPYMPSQMLAPCEA